MFLKADSFDDCENSIDDTVTGGDGAVVSVSESMDSNEGDRNNGAGSSERLESNNITLTDGKGNGNGVAPSGTRRSETGDSEFALDKGDFTSHVVGCVINQGAEIDTATGHTCTCFNVPVHALCCQRVLNIPVYDPDDPLYCSRCYEEKFRMTVSTQKKVMRQHTLEGMIQQGGSITSQLNIIAGRERTEDSENVGSAACNKKRSGSFGRMYQTARKNWELLLCNGAVFRPMNTKKRRDDDEIREALRFIFSPQNVQLLSWGSKRVRVDRVWVSLPAVMRRKTIEHIFRDYQTFIRTTGNRNAVDQRPLGRSAFLESSCRAGVVKGELHQSDRYETYLRQIDSIEEFIKFTYLEHIGADDDPIHDPQFALSQTKLGDGGASKQSEYSTCMKTLQIIENIKTDFPVDREDVELVLGDVQDKIMLYYGHQHRCYNQERRIAALFDELRQSSTTDSAVVLLDYKMKFEPIRYREKSTEFFGKKGISWHGAAISFYGRVPSSQSSSQRREPEGAEVYDIQTLFLDHIISNNMTHGMYAVCCLLHAVLARVKVELLTVQRITLLSDNETCYQNDLLPALAPFIAKEHGIPLQGIVHSVTQRGKSLLDANFALAMMYMNRFCSESRKDVTTPRDVVVALNSTDGVANCTAELVHIDRAFDQMKQ